MSNAVVVFLLIAALIALAVYLIVFGFAKLKRPAVVVQPPKPAPVAVVKPVEPPVSSVIAAPPAVTNAEPKVPEPPVVTNVIPAPPAETNALPSGVSTQPEASAKPPTISWPAIKVNGIVGRGRTGSAILNGKVVPIGESIEGAHLVEIGKHPSVTLEFKGERKTLRINESTL